MKWFIKCLRQYADFKGRARRKEYWWFAVFNFIFTIIILIPFMVQMFKLGMTGVDMSDEELYGVMLTSPYMWIYVIYYLAMLIPGIAVCVRRLHDIGRSGWWFLLILGASILNFVSRMIAETNFIALMVMMLLILAISIIGLVWMFTDSEYGPNKYGPNPKGEGNTEVPAEN